MFLSSQSKAKNTFLRAVHCSTHNEKVKVLNVRFSYLKYNCSRGKGYHHRTYIRLLETLESNGTVVVDIP